ncbi:hypothetical protein H4219_003710 [Mycoemilia scoparia]|uniref:AB hydrolase-1 domain-containing protein n=1 Tax=Mycoemilia scoparia TaxID=417184 RepID=A0A9W8A222_9FUNG|nr:hypothetical protein H4219_003710 [Mycoemilia scoparia]
MNVSSVTFQGHTFPIRLSAKVYTPKQSKTKNNNAARNNLTLLITHANGFHKELWEPILRRLFERQASVEANSIDHNVGWWIEKAIAIDAQNHGDSALLNKGHLNKDVFYWTEHAKDIQAILGQIHIGESKLVGVGHSFGGSSLLLTEIERPGSFYAIAAIDPTIRGNLSIVQGIADKARRRKNGWESEQAAREYFLSKDLFAVWDKEILGLHIEHGLYSTVADNAQKMLALKCDPAYEAATFSGWKEPIQIIFSRIKEISARVRIINGQVSVICPPDHAKKLSSMMKNADFRVVEKTGHLVVMENPVETEKELAAFLDEISANWKISPKSPFPPNPRL